MDAWAGPRYGPAMRVRLGVALMLAGIGLGIVAQTATAKTFFRSVGGKTFVQGQVVRTEILGCRGNDACSRAVKGLRVFLAPGPPALRGRADGGGLRPAGRVTPQGTLAFRVPGPPGTWHLLARPFRGARELLPVSAAFTVQAPAPPPPTPPPPDPYG
jgi:hypothetical protein